MEINVLWNGDSCTVTVVRPEAMEDIGNGMWMLPQPPDGSKWFYMDIKGPLFVRKCVRDICEKVIFPAILRNEGEKTSMYDNGNTRNREVSDDELGDCNDPFLFQE